MQSRVHITGMGCISSLGKNTGTMSQSLHAGKTGIGPIRHLTTRHKDSFVAGEIPFSNQELADLAGSALHARTTLLGIIAAKEALASSGFKASKKIRSGFISSTTVAGMSDTELLYKDFFEKKQNANFIDRHFSGAGTEIIAKALGITDYVSTISTACSSAANAIMQGARLILHGHLDRVVVGGTDALSLFTLNGFNTLMILDKDWCRPFDETRKGLNLGEAAAYLVLESNQLVEREGKKSLALLSGYSNTNDAFHQTASSAEGEGAQLAMRRSLQVAGLKAADISYVNAHGTGTPNNDSSEGLAMQAVFENKVPLFSSTKAFTGHTLAAAASVEAVISLLSMQAGCIFPNLNQRENMKDLNIAPVTEKTEKQNLQHVMSNSFGFGGNCSSLIFSRN